MGRRGSPGYGFPGNRAFWPSVLWLVLAALALFLPAFARAADDVQVGAADTRVEHRMTPGENEARFFLDRFCFDGNGPTAESRLVVDFYAAVPSGVAVIDGRSQWIGDGLQRLRDAHARAVPHLPLRPVSLSDPARLRMLGQAELALADRSPEAVFPDIRGGEAPSRFIVRVPAAGERRTIAVTTCYSADELREILAIRGRAAQRMIDALAEVSE